MGMDFFGRLGLESFWSNEYLIFLAKFFAFTDGGIKWQY